MLHATPTMDAEHLAVFGARDALTNAISGGLVPDAGLSIESVGSGPLNWSDRNSWVRVSGGKPTGVHDVPRAGDDVLIVSGTTVVVDGLEDRGNTVSLHAIRVDGTLQFATDVNTKLLVDTIIVEPSGVFQMGTDDRPIGPGVKADVTFADNGPIDTTWDPYLFSRGLVSHGTVSIHGSEVKSFVAALTTNTATGATAIAKGAKSITLPGAIPAGWKVGDRLVISGNTASNGSGVNQDEEVSIVSLKPVKGNTVVTFTDKDNDPVKAANAKYVYAGLKYAHSAPAGGGVYVADVTRNAVFESQDVQHVGERGHVMFMHNENVHVAGAGFYGLGRTDKRNPIDDPVPVDDPAKPGTLTDDVIDSKTKQRVMVPVVDAAGNPVKNADGTPKLQVARTGLNPRGRYGVHFHRTGTEDADNPATISDSAVVDSPGWGIVNHSSNVDVTGNVVFNVVGAAYSTEAGDEIGSFVGNIAIKSTGSGAGIEARKEIGDFGHQGDGFWLQGGNVSLVGNVATGQRHAGYVFFPVGLNQKGLGVTKIEAHNLDWLNLGPNVDPESLIAVGDVPLKRFEGNVAGASGEGMETWFSLRNIKDQARRTVIDDFTAWGLGGTGIFSPYTNNITYKDVTLVGNLGSPRNTAFGRNTVTANAVYDHVDIQGWNVGIDVPINGKFNRIVGGRFDNLKNFRITTSNGDRVINIDDADSTDRIQFLDTLAAKGQLDVFLESNFNPKEQDITKLFSKDVIQMGTVRYNGQQLYYREQGADFVPFSSKDPATPKYIPAGLLDLRNADLFTNYGLAIGGVVAPASASSPDASDPTALKTNALIGQKAAYLPDLALASAKYTRFRDPSDLATAKVGLYKLSYKITDPATGKVTTVKETTPTTLSAGWNLLTRTINKVNRTLLVYGDNTLPSFDLDDKVPTTLNQADIDNGANIVISGKILDDSIGSKNFRQTFSLKDVVLGTADDGTKTGTLSFTIKDNAGNAYLVQIVFAVTDTSTLQKDLGRKTLPTIKPSITLVALLGHS